MSELDRPLDLRVARKLEIDASMICPRPQNCPILSLCDALSGSQDFDYAKGVCSKWPEVSMQNEEKAAFFVHCQVEVRDELPCGVLEVKQTLLKRESEILFRSRQVITEDNMLTDNPFFIPPAHEKE